MFDWYKNDIIRRLKNSDYDSAIIGLGDSFTQGHGACSVKLWEKCNWNVNVVPTTSLWDYQIEYYENSWVNQLVKNHMSKFVSINMGMNGRGNRAAGSELFLHPDLELEKIKNKIVVFMLSGNERFDIVHKNYNEHIHFKTIWPSYDSQEPDKDLWSAYAEHGYSDKMSIIELLLIVKQVRTWCELNNATLILTSAFRPEYNRDYFIETIRGERDDKKNFLYHRLEYIEKLVDYIDWYNFLRPNGFRCFSDFLCSLEGREDLIDEKGENGFYYYSKSLDKMSPNGYFTNCAHPSILGHTKFAEVIFEHILKQDKNLLKNNIKNGKKIFTDII